MGDRSGDIGLNSILGSETDLPKVGRVGRGQVEVWKRSFFCDEGDRELSDQGWLVFPTGDGISQLLVGVD